MRIRDAILCTTLGLLLSPQTPAEPGVDFRRLEQAIGKGLSNPDAYRDFVKQELPDQSTEEELLKAYLNQITHSGPRAVTYWLNQWGQAIESGASTEEISLLYQKMKKRELGVFKTMLFVRVRLGAEFDLRLLDELSEDFPIGARNLSRHIEAFEHYLKSEEKNLSDFEKIFLHQKIMMGTAAHRLIR